MTPLLCSLALIMAVLAEPEDRTAIDPDDPEALLAHAAAFKEADDEDGALAYLIRALDATERLEMDEKDRQSALRAIEAKIGAADRASKGLRSALQKYNVELGEVLRLHGRNPKRTKNALEVAGRILAFDPAHGTANQVVDALLEDADESLKRQASLALARRDLRRTRAFRADWAREHGTWDAPGIARTEGYFVRSTIGFSTVERAANALEQISHFYRSFYGVRPEGNQFGRTKVWLYRTRAEFDELAPSAQMTARKDIKGFLQTTSGNGLPAFGLYSYDPLDDGMARGNIWSTLFHEASHQYMALAAGVGSPTWLNEGMACYFEGAYLDGRGEVQVGLPAARRLFHLSHLLDRNPLRKTLNATGHIDGDQYPVAWGIVYFLHHYQTDDGSWPYRDALHEAIRLSGGRTRSPYAVFEEAVLTPRQLVFETLKDDWARWIIELARRERDPAAATAWHRERAQRFLQAGNLEAAEEAYLQVRMRAPDDARAALALARIAAERPDEDRTLTLARFALSEAERVDDAETGAAAEELARSIDRAGFVRLRKAEQKYRDQIRGQVRRHLEERRPMTAFAVAERYLDRVLGESHAESVARAVNLGAVHPVARVLAPFDGETKVGLICAPNAFRVDQGELIGAPPESRPVAVFVEEPVAPSFRMQGELFVRDVDSVVGLVITLPDTLETVGLVARPTGGVAMRRPPAPFGGLDFGAVATLHRASRRAKTAYYATEDFELEGATVADAALVAGEWTKFALDRGDDGRLQLSIAGTPVASLDSATAARDVSIGLLVCSGEARIKDLRILERGRL